MNYILDKRLSALYKKIDLLEQAERYTELTSVYEECIQISLSTYGECHEETLALFSEYGGLLRNLGRYEESLQYLKRALHIADILKGTRHPDYASALVNLANLLRMMHYTSESKLLFLKAKQIYEENKLEHSFQYAGLCNNLGLLYQEIQHYEKAIPLHEQSLIILENDAQHEILYGVTLNNLVEPYKATGQRAKAIDFLKKAIHIFQKHKEQASLLYATAINNLGTIYYEDQKYEKARNCFLEALSISREKLGTESESYQHSLTNYRHVLKKLETAAQASEQTKLLQSSKGLDISESYFFEVALPVLERDYGQYLPRMAAGLVGEGSECYGFDDEISRDHDFGPSFQLFIPKEDMDVYGKQLQQSIAALPKSYGGFEARNVSLYGEGRVGVLTIEGFYDKYLSIHEVPSTNRLWLQMEDIPLSTATNGRVFMDNLGRFTAIRNGLLNHYPQDVRLKRMAAECMQIAQSGQYNLPRSLKRRQYVAASHALDEFVTHFCLLIYLINKTYKPYYKWEHEGLKKLPVLGQVTYREMEKLVLVPLHEKPNYAIFIVEELCKKAIDYLRQKQLSSSTSDFLLDHGPEIMQRITDEQLRFSNPWTMK